MRLRRHERVEYAVRLVGIYSPSRVPYRQDNRVGAVMGGTHTQYPGFAFDSGHSVDRVVDEVEDDLLDLAPMPHDRLQFHLKLQTGRNAMILEFSAQGL
jgi:hypothetical protein